MGGQAIASLLPLPARQLSLDPAGFCQGREPTARGVMGIKTYNAGWTYPTEGNCGHDQSSTSRDCIRHVSYADVHMPSRHERYRRRYEASHPKALSPFRFGHGPPIDDVDAFGDERFELVVWKRCVHVWLDGTLDPGSGLKSFGMQ